MNQKQLLDELHSYRVNAIATESINPEFDIFSNYWAMREQAWEYQRKHNISGLVERTFTVDGISYSVPQAESQLILTRSDLSILREAKARLVEIFLNHARDRNIFEHIQDFGDGEDYPYVLIPLSRFHQRVQKSDWAEIYCLRSDDNLHLSLGCGEDPAKSVFVGNKYTRDNYSFVIPLVDSLPRY